METLPPLTLQDRLIRLADCWCEVNDRSASRLATIVANDGKLIDRLRGGGGCTVATIERFFAFFRVPTNWRDYAVPALVGELLDGVDLSASVHAASGTTPDDSASHGNSEENSTRAHDAQRAHAGAPA